MSPRWPSRLYTPGNCFESGTLRGPNDPAKSTASQAASSGPGHWQTQGSLFRVPKGAPGGGACVSVRLRAAPHRSPWLSFRSHAFTSRTQPVGPAGSRAPGGARQGDSWLAGGLSGGGGGGGAHARQRFLAQRHPCACCRSARGGPARSRRGGRGAPAGRGPEPGWAGAGMPLFFSALLALLLVALSALFLGR